MTEFQPANPQLEGQIMPRQPATCHHGRHLHQHARHRMPTKPFDAFGLRAMNARVRISHAQDRLTLQLESADGTIADLKKDLTNLRQEVARSKQEGAKEAKAQVEAEMQLQIQHAHKEAAADKGAILKLESQVQTAQREILNWESKEQEWKGKTESLEKQVHEYKVLSAEATSAKQQVASLQLELQTQTAAAVRYQTSWEAELQRVADLKMQAQQLSDEIDLYKHTADRAEKAQAAGRLELAQVKKELQLWLWQKEEKTFQGWELASVEWKHLLGKPTNYTEILNEKWSIDWSRDKWKEFWNRLWKSELFLRDKTWLWRVIHNGLCVGARLKKRGITQGFCPWCDEEIESVEHCMLTCDLVKGRWDRLSLLYLLGKVQPEPVPNNSPMEFLDVATHQKALKLPLLLLLVSQTRTAWRVRCNKVFQRRRQITPTLAVLSNSVQTGTEIAAGLQQGEHRKLVEVGLAYLQLMLEIAKTEYRRQEADATRLQGGTWSAEDSPLPLPSSTTQQFSTASDEHEGLMDVQTDPSRYSCRGHGDRRTPH
ncbi:hypothetical protein R1sor_013681 [Riccia sorocarpa]|uniref:Reverse transcriptase zinc-binding domain-containing protein n=1 Tax=Riccia sorocarpa TaxID=122646 RepID=A0ABD3HA83_9MARC